MILGHSSWKRDDRGCGARGSSTKTNWVASGKVSSLVSDGRPEDVCGASYPHSGSELVYDPGIERSSRR